MPDFPIHDLEGSLTPTMPVIMPTQLKPAVRKFSPDELGIKEDRPPVQLSSQAIQLLQRNNMHDLFRGMKFFGAGIDQPECILRSSWAAKPKVLSLVTAGATRIGWPKESVQAYPAHQQWHRPYFISIRSCTKSDVPSTSFISWTGKTKQVSSRLAMPQHNGQFIAYSFQSPRAFTWTLRRGTAAVCRNKTTIPWQPAPTLSAYDGIDAPFVNSNQNCIWFAFPHGPRGHYVVGHRHIGTFRYTGCIPCLLSWLVAKVTCKAHTSSTSYPELSGVMFVDQTGHVAVAADHDWQVYNTADFPTCLVIATIDQRLFRYTEHAHSLPAVNPIGTVTNELCNDWHRDGFPPSVAYFLCTLTTSPQ